MKEYILKVNGMMCNGCENRIQNVLKEIDGIESIVANHLDGSVKITTSKQIDISLIKEQIEDIGYEVI